MNRLRLEAPLVSLSGVGPKRWAELQRGGFHTAGDLLAHLPHRYHRIRSLTLAELGAVGEGDAVRTRGRLVKLYSDGAGRRSRVHAAIEEGDARLELIWFHRGYLVRELEKGGGYTVTGKLDTAKDGGLQMTNPRIVAAAGDAADDCIEPVYAAIGSLRAHAVRRLQQALLDSLDWSSIDDPLPEELRRRRELPRLGESLLRLHAPPADADVEALDARSSPWHRRLAYEELLAVRLRLEVARAQARATRKRHAYQHIVDLPAAVEQRTGFELTAAQRRCITEMSTDMESSRPMQRLLQGDVGAGKTVVAFAASLLALESGLQTLIVAPTELLAEQHHQNWLRWCAGRLRPRLVTAGSADVARPSDRLVIGTHALLHAGGAAARPSLVIIDEQHRFGVEQRQRLRDRGADADLLVVTATPIPRSLAMILYGDLDHSVLDESPRGERRVRTAIVGQRRRQAVYDRLERRLEAGEKAYVVFPAIDAAEKRPVASLEREGSELARRFARYGCGVLHGRLDAAERRRLIARFGDGDVRLLLSTTVVEVGVDVPDVTLMVIESAEVFGLAQLHQLRGRIGRGERAAACVAVHGELSPEGMERLAAFRDTLDGFRIAEMDLAIRGPGELLGTQQAGMPRLRYADLVRHAALLRAAREDAVRLCREGFDPSSLRSAAASPPDRQSDTVAPAEESNELSAG